MSKVKKSNKGSTLAIILIVFAVLSILGITIMSLALASTKHASYQENKIQSYYVARSGADATAEYILRNVTSISGMNSLISTIGPGNLGTGTFEGFSFVIDLTGDANSEIVIKSTGIANNISSNATLTLNKIKPFENVIHTNDDLNVVPLTAIAGNLSSNGTVTYSSGYEENYTVTHNAGIIWDEPEFPTIFLNAPEEQIPLEVRASDNFTLVDNETEYTKNTAEYYFPSIAVDNSRILTFETNDILKIVTRSLNIGSTGKIDVQGTGTVFIFVIDEANIATGMADFYNDPNQLILYMQQGSSLTMDSNGGFKGFIYGPNASLIIGNPNTQITGAMIFNTFVTTMPQNSGSVYFNFMGIDSIPELQDYIKIKEGSTQFQRGIWK